MDRETLSATVKDANNLRYFKLNFRLQFQTTSGLLRLFPTLCPSSYLSLRSKVIFLVQRGSKDQKVKKRKNRECTKCAKKTKTIQHSLCAIGEEIKEIEPENDSMLQMLQRKELGIKQQEADFCDSQNKIITAHENCVGALLQEPLVQNLMAGSNQLAIAQCVGFSPNANSDDRIPSEDGIAELKHRSKMLDKHIEVLCKIFIGGQA